MSPLDVRPIAGTEAEAEAVFDALVAIWPEQMTTPTGSGLAWGQLIAVCAVEAIASTRNQREDA